MEENEIIYSDIPVTEEHEEITVDEIMPVIEIAEIESYEIEMQEAFPSTEGNNSYNHALLNNREIHDAHPISAITGLREELNDIEALKTVYSDKKGNADYYEWAEGSVIDGVGRFVTLNEDVHTISICTGDDIFGVVVDNAAFVGGQDDVARDGRYGLVATSGAVHVRCELDVDEGNYVVSNSRGIATKTTSNYGYKVVALHDIDGLAYATISLDIAADQVDSIGKKLQNLDGRVDANYNNIISATNWATLAYSKATQIDTSNKEMSDKVDGALGKVDQMASDVANMSEQVSSSVAMSAQANAIANSAATYAKSMKDEIIDEVNETLVSNAELNEKFELIEEQIGDVEDEVTIVTNRINRDYEVISFWNEAKEKELYDPNIVYYAEDKKLYHYYENGDWRESELASEAGLPVAISGIQVKVDEHSSTFDSLASWQDETRSAITRIEQKADANGAYIQSTVSNIDKYAVGPYSQADGFTLIQAKSVLEPGMIYTPTEEVEESYIIDNDPAEWFEDDEKKVKDYNKVYYKVSENNKKYWYYNWTDKKWTEADPANELPSTLPRTFLPGYLYKWGELKNGSYGWTTVDKNYDELEGINDSTKSVFWSPMEIVISKDDPNNKNYGYWYTLPNEDGNILDKNGAPTDKYEPYTLYRWDLLYKYSTEDDGGETTEEYGWIAVARLAGNMNSRAVTQIRQDTNSISLRVTNTEKSVAGVQTTLSNTSATVESLASWKNGSTETDKVGMAIIRQEANNNVASIVISTLQKVDGKITEGASLQLNASEDGNSLIIGADNINLTGAVTIGSFSNDVATKFNNSIAETKIEYALSLYSDRFVPVDNMEWSTVAPTWQEGCYMWQQTTIKYTGEDKDDTVTTTCIQGAKGRDGVSYRGLKSSTNVIITNQDGSYTPEKITFSCFQQFGGGTVDVDAEGYFVVAEQYETSRVSIYEADSLAKSFTWNIKNINSSCSSIVCTMFGYREERYDDNGEVESVEYYDLQDTINIPIIHHGEDSYTAFLTNETHIFSESDLSQEISIGTVPTVYQGSNSIEVKNVISINGTTKRNSQGYFDDIGIAGLNAQVIGSHWIYFTVSSGFTGSHSIPIVFEADGKQFEKVFNCSLVEQGNGIASITEYYTATKTKDKPERYLLGTTIITKKWKTNVEDVTYNESNPYLWKFERIEYTHMEDNKDTEVILLSSIPRVVVSVFTRYCLSTNGYVLQESPEPEWSNSFDEIFSAYDQRKKTDPNTMYYIWSQEVVEYNTGEPDYGNPTANSANSAIAYWCKDHDITRINGGQIATGSITSASLSTDAVKSLNYETGNVESEEPEYYEKGANIIRKVDFKTSPVVIDNKNSKSKFGLVSVESSANEIVVEVPQKNIEYTLSFTVWTDAEFSDVQQYAYVSVSTAEDQSYLLYINGKNEEDNPTHAEAGLSPRRYSATIPAAVVLDTTIKLDFGISFAPSDTQFQMYPVYLTDIKLEGGSVATGWVPSYEDSKKGINFMKEKYLIDSVQTDYYNSASKVGFISKTGIKSTYSITLEPNTDYTISFKAWLTSSWIEGLQSIGLGYTSVTDNIRHRITLYDKSNTTEGDGYPDLTTTPNRFFGHIFKKDILNNQTIVFEFLFAYSANLYDQYGSSYLRDVIVTDIKLETGLTATAWTSPPENTESEETIPEDIELIEKGALVPDNGYAAKGTYLDLKTGNMYSENFYMHNGNVSMKGEIVAKKGQIGNFYVTNDGGLISNIDINTPYIGENGNWWIDEIDTKIEAQGTDSQIPIVGENGNWWIGEVDTTIKAQERTVQIGNDGTIVAPRLNTVKINANQIGDASEITCLAFKQKFDATTYESYGCKLLIKRSKTNTAVITIEYSDMTSRYGHYVDGSLNPTNTVKLRAVNIFTGETFYEYVTLTPGEDRFEYTLSTGANTVVFATSGKVYLTFAYSVPLGSEDTYGITCRGSFAPVEKNKYTLGGEELPWKILYASRDGIKTSDLNEKNTITPLTDKHSEVFDKLIPVTYKFNVNTSDRTHVGLIAQDVKQAIDEVGIDSKDFAAYCEWEKKDGTIGCGLRYGEFIAMCIYEIQKLKTQVKELESKLSEEQHDET